MHLSLARWPDRLPAGRRPRRRTGAATAVAGLLLTTAVAATLAAPPHRATPPPAAPGPVAPLLPGALPGAADPAASPGGPSAVPLSAADRALLQALLRQEASDVRAPARPAAAARAPLPAWWTPVIGSAAEQSGLPAALIAAVVQVESGGDPSAVSPAGAEGLMQLLPSTAAELGVSDIFDPLQNVVGGARYLAAWLLRYSGSEPSCLRQPQACPGALTLALAAYNAGPGAVARYGGVPPYPQTQRYVALVTDLFARYRAEA